MARLLSILVAVTEQVAYRSDSDGWTSIRL